MHAEPDTKHTLQRSVALATELIPNCHYAGISMVHRNGTIDTPAATHELVNRGDELQYALGEGPCLDAIWHYDTVISANLAEEDRWTTWAPRVAAELNIHSMLALRLFTSTELVGGLNLYSKDIDAFDEDDAYTGTYLAAQIAVAVAEEQQTDSSTAHSTPSCWSACVKTAPPRTTSSVASPRARPSATSNDA